MTGMPTIAFALRIIRENNLALNPRDLVRKKHQTFREYVHYIRPVDVVADIMREQIGKMPMAVGTGASRESAMLQLKQLGFETFFDAIVTADDVARHKPEPETFLTCARLMGINTTDCQVFEDGILGMEAARAAGMMVTDVKPFITYLDWNFS
jgi:HAD superfamily hydrolase (TIGR01509 family)